MMNDTGMKQTARVPIAGVSENVGVSDAFITYVIVRSKGIEYGNRVNFKGVSLFTEEVRKHIREIIVPIVDEVLDGLAVERTCYDISVANLPTASVQGSHIRIEGFSADVAVFISMLSAVLEIPFSGDILATGHIASCCGEIIPVKALESKLKAAINDETIKKFIYPDYQCAAPLPEYHHIKSVLSHAVTSIQLSSVTSIYDCIEQSYESYQIVLSSLRKGYFEFIPCSHGSSHFISKSILYLANNNLQRFWREARTLIMTGRIDPAKELLGEFCRYYIRRQKYPSNAGRTLSMMISAVPRHIRVNDGFYPLCDVGLCIKMGQFADGKEHHDFITFLNCITGADKTEQFIETMPSFQPVSAGLQNTAFDAVVNKLNQKSLAVKIDIPIDAAQGSFVHEKAVVNGYEEFLDVITAFVVHLRCHIDKADMSSLDIPMCRNDALELIEKAFQNQGGCQAAYIRALEGTDSGIRGVFNKMVDQYKYDLKTKYANRVLKEAVNIMDWDERVDFMRIAIDRIGNLLPQELRNQPPERFAREFEAITRAIIKSLDKMNDVFAGY